MKIIFLIGHNNWLYCIQTSDDCTVFPIQIPHVQCKFLLWKTIVRCRYGIQYTIIKSMNIKIKKSKEKALHKQGLQMAPSVRLERTTL